MKISVYLWTMRSKFGPAAGRSDISVVGRGLRFPSLQGSYGSMWSTLLRDTFKGLDQKLVTQNLENSGNFIAKTKYILMQNVLSTLLTLPFSKRKSRNSTI